MADLMHQAVHYFQNGDLGGAEQITHQILAKQPRNSDALHLLGVISAIGGKPSAAAMLFKKALARDARNIELHANLAKALCELGRFEEALASYQKAIKLGGGGANVAGIVMDQGTALKQLGRHAEALSCYDKALALRPDSAEAWTNKGTLLDGLQRHEEAIACHDKAISISPRLAIAWFNKATVLDTLNKYEAALACYDQAISLLADNPRFWSNRGVTLGNIKRYEEALTSYAKALSIQPDYAEAWSNRGLALNELRRYDEALASYDRALDLQPDYAQAWTNRGVLLQDLKRHQEALENYATALAIAPDHAGAHYNAGICRLAIGDFERGWQDYEWRWEYSMKGKNPFPDIPKWEGEKNTPSLLLWAEQGIGDQILYASMLEELKQYCGKLTVSLDARLIPLFRRSFSQIQFVAHDESLLHHAVEMQVPIGSIGGFLRKNISDFSRQKAPYLEADVARTADLRRRIRKDSRPVCGLSWTSTNEKIGSSKSMVLQDLLPILSCDRLSFVDLQYGDTSLERLNMKTSSGIDIGHIDDIDNFNDIDGLASLIDACDFVVTVSNVTAHLAGALGKKTYLLVPYAHGKLWYWHLGRENSLWYPSVTAFSQAVDGDWESVVAEVLNQINPSAFADS